MVEQTELRKLLVLHGPTFEARGTLSFLREHFDVHVTDQLETALEAMRHCHFDAVLAETADFLPLERGMVTQQAAAVLDTLGDGVCLIGPQGEMLWTNRRLREASQELLASVSDICRRSYEHFATQQKPNDDHGRRFSVRPADGSYFEVICSPVRDHKGLLRQVVAVVIDASHQRRQQLKLNAIDRAGRELVNLEREALTQRDAAERLRLLEERIISCSRQVLDYKHFAVLLLDERTNRLEVLVCEGLDTDRQDFELFASPEGNGICGYVAASGRSYICPDVQQDSRYLSGLSDARSSLTVPLRLSDRVVGVLNVESDQPGAFTEEDRQFAEIFANHLALAMHILNLLVCERHTIHNQVSGSICAELSGPINDIITEATEAMEDYIGHDPLRKRLQEVIDRACDARDFIRSLSEADQTGVMGSPNRLDQHDPLLSGKSVMVADDEDLIRRTLRDVLTGCGCEVDVASEGSQAREKIAQKCYDLIISDIKMPGATGYDIFAAAKQACGQTQVILITAFGYDPHHSIVRATKEGLAAVLMKPFKINQLLAECRHALSAGS